MELKFTSDNFEAEVLKSDVPVLVDFYADWCVPCKQMAPIIEALAVEYGPKMKIGKLDVDESSDIALKYGIMSIPTLVLFKDGEVFRKEIGVKTKKTMEAVIAQAL